MSPSRPGGGTKEIEERIAALEIGKLDADRVTDSESVTVPGWAADARQLNASISGTMAEKLQKAVQDITARYITAALYSDYVWSDYGLWYAVNGFAFILPNMFLKNIQPGVDTAVARLDFVPPNETGGMRGVTDKGTLFNAYVTRDGDLMIKTNDSGDVHVQFFTTFPGKFAE